MSAERDPLADLVSRSVGGHIDAVVAEPLAAEGLERKRLRFERSGAAATAIFERAAPGATLEAQLLPFLARKTDRVPAVYSRGLPPPHARLGPWLLLEDVLAGGEGCDDPAAIVRAKLEVERAVARDHPALRALGLRERDLPAALAPAPLGLVHGALTCASARRVARGVVIVGWSRAFLGPTVIDAASLANDLARRGDDAGAAEVREAYVSATGDDVEDRWRAATAFGLA